jgi:hypothetical protein
VTTVEVKPVYTTSTVNEPIELYSGALVLDQDGRSISGTGSVQLKWTPRPRLVFAISRKPHSEHMELKRAQLRFVSLGQTAEVHITGQQFSSDSEAHLVTSGRVGFVEVGNASRLASLVFHIPNFHAFHTSVIEVDGWRLTFGPIRDRAEDLKKQLEDAGGYGITHVGNLEKIDGTTFAFADAKVLVDSLPHFLSFCRGAWVAPYLLVGFDTSGVRVWEQWSSLKVERWRSLSTWFDECIPEAMKDTFPGYWKHWRDEMWAEPIRLALHWYVEGNLSSGGVEGSVILAQAAFEMLAWTLLVEERKVLSAGTFDSNKLPAMEKLRLLIHACEIPLNIPASLTELAAMAKEYNWTDGPQSLTEYRNGLVHSNPDKRRRIFDARVDPRFDTWRLSLWYLELVLLKLFDYRGSYGSRIANSRWRGEVERVPWALP